MVVTGIGVVYVDTIPGSDAIGERLLGEIPTGDRLLYAAIVVGAAERLGNEPARVDGIERRGVGEPLEGGFCRRNISAPILGTGGSSLGGDDARRLIPEGRPNESSSLSCLIPLVSSLGKSNSSATVPGVDTDNVSSGIGPLLFLRILYGERSGSIISFEER